MQTKKMYAPGRAITTIVTDLGVINGRQTYRLIYQQDFDKLHILSPSRKGVTLYYQKMFLRKWAAENLQKQIVNIFFLNQKGTRKSAAGGGWRCIMSDGSSVDFVTDPAELQN